tara:strand:- start:581 stop:715 length:135 start_codon:yes stop_codon:yes gene_type:complete
LEKADTAQFARIKSGIRIDQMFGKKKKAAPKKKAAKSSKNTRMY